MDGEGTSGKVLKEGLAAGIGHRKGYISQIRPFLSYLRHLVHIHQVTAVDAAELLLRQGTLHLLQTRQSHQLLSAVHMNDDIVAFTFHIKYVLAPDLTLH